MINFDDYTNENIIAQFKVALHSFQIIHTEYLL